MVKKIKYKQESNSINSRSLEKIKQSNIKFIVSKLKETQEKLDKEDLTEKEISDLQRVYYEQYNTLFDIIKDEKTIEDLLK